MREKPLILIVDDDNDFREVVVTKLRENAFDIVEARDGDEGVQKAKETVPDLILMDVKMPKMDGIQALVQLKKDPATKDCKIVFLTAFGDPSPLAYKNDQRFAREMGADDYVVKSEDLSVIVEKVRAVLKRQK